MTDTDIPQEAPQEAGTEQPSAVGSKPAQQQQRQKQPRPQGRQGQQGQQKGQPRPPQQQQPQPHQQNQRARKVHPVLETLFALYPKMFGAHFLPLKLGVFQDLLVLHPDAFKKEDLKVALGLHARSTRYLEAVAAGHQRHDLQGVPVELVAPEHVHHAILEVFKRRQARSNEDLRPHVIERIVAAIEASGLSRDDYAVRVRTQDETTNALLDEAVAELGRQAAKREALLRAFTASGRSTEAEFAEMYGMDVNQVARMLERARADQLAAQAAPTTPSAEESA